MSTAAIILTLMTGSQQARALTGTTPTVEEAIAGTDWPYYNRSLDGQRYSPLAQVTAANAASLVDVCRLRVSDAGSFQAGLIVVGTMLYATQANDTIAIDAVTCAVRWRHHYIRSQTAILPINRGVAYANGRLFRGTDDARLIALDAKTGAELWTDVIGDARLGEWLAAAPVAVNGLVIAGTVAGEFGIRGRVLAFDAQSGREIWHFHTIPVGKEVGANTWVKTNWNLHGGGGTWSTFTVDPGTEEVFIPVGNPTPDYSPGDRPGQNLFSNSVVALDLLSGKVNWWYQTKTNDAQDSDLAAAPLLYRDAQGQERVAVAGKDGYLHIIDRNSHKLVRKVAITTIDETPQKPSTTGVRMCPGPAGGVEWNGPAFDSVNGSLFVGAVDYCGIFRSNPGVPFAPGGLNFGGTWSPTTETPTGWITSVDSTTGKIKWRFHAEAPVVSGITATAGGIVMGGDNAGNFLVFNSSSGELLKKVATGGSLSGGVITYLQNDTQYIAFTSGNISRTVFGAVGRPSIIIMALASTGSSVPPNLRNNPDATHGRQLFLGMCAGCHGSDGKSVVYDGGDLTNVKQRMSFAQIVAWIKDPQPPMPKVFPEPLQESEDRDLQDIAKFISEWPQ